MGSDRAETGAPLSGHARWVGRVYGAAADHYGRHALGFWDRFGAATVARLRLAPGGTLLDLRYGAGASAIPAARAVGQAGRVVGPCLFEPASSVFWQCVGEAEPTLYKNFNPWDEITTPTALAGLLTRAGVPHPAVTAVARQHQLEHPDRSGRLSSAQATGPPSIPSPPAGRSWSASASWPGYTNELTTVRTDVVVGTARRPG